MRVLSDKENLKLIISVSISVLVGFLLSYLNIFLGIVVSILLVIIFIYFYLKKREDRVNELLVYLKALNNGNYNYNLSEYKEGELAKLHSELNKTTIIIKNKNQDLIKQQKITTQAIEDIAHQLKTPIASLLLLNELQDKDDLVTRSKDQLLRLNYLSDSLLKLVKLDSNLEEFNVEKISVEKLLNETSNLMSPSLNHLQLNIEHNYEIIMCDYYKTKEALINILNNKVRYASSTITISVTQDKLSTYIKISDDGVEINDYEKGKIFERFYSGKNKDSKSIGIGLSIAKEYIERQDGRLYIEDKNTFVIKFNNI